MQVIQSGLILCNKTSNGRGQQFTGGEVYPFEKVQGFAETWYRVYAGCLYEVFSSETFFEHFTKQKGTLK